MVESKSKCRLQASTASEAITEEAGSVGKGRCMDRMREREREKNVCKKRAIKRE